MILFDPSMQTERIAVIGFAIIIIAALSFFILSQENPETGRTYLEDIAENLFGEATPLTIEEGDCADVSYSLNYASNDTFIEDSSDSGPLKIFVSLDNSEPPQDYSNYSSLLIEGFLQELIGLSEGQEHTFTLTAENAYGYPPQIGDEITFPAPVSQVITIRDIKENVPMPEEFISDFGDVNTTVLSLRTKVEVGDTVTMYSPWENATEYTFVNETTAYLYTTPPEDKMNNFTWVNVTTGMQYSENASSITSINDTTIIIQHNPVIGDALDAQGMFTVVNITSDTINCSYTNPYTGNTSYALYNRVDTIKRNESQELVVDYPIEGLQEVIYYYSYYGIEVDYPFSFSPLAGESLKYTITIDEVYKTSD